jgi:penicillin-binding protein-related factor A (putative recombinase)
MRGRSLELAVKHAAIAYRKEGRECVLVQQYPRTGTGKDGVLIYAGDAPADFLGAIDNYPAAVECKETARKSFPLSKIEPDQRAALDAFEESGFDVRLIVDLTGLEECYVLPWFQVAAFIMAPWRKSLSLTWLRAFGQLAPYVEVNGQFRCLFLDAVAHPEAEQCLLDVWDERKSKPLVSLDGDDDDEPVEQKVSPYKGLTQDQIKERLMEAVHAGLVRQRAAKPKRAPRWGKKRSGGQP